MCVPYVPKPSHVLDSWVLGYVTPDITGLLQFKFWDLVLFSDYTYAFPEKGGNERLGRWLGRAPEYGDSMCYWILNIETEQLLVRSTVRPFTTTKQPNTAYMEQVLSSPLPKPTKSPVIKNPVMLSDNSVVEDTEEVSDQPKMYSTRVPIKVDPDSLIDLFVNNTRKTRTGGTIPIREQVKERISDNQYRIAYDNGKNQILDYNELVNLLNKDDEEKVDRWVFEDIVGHRPSKDVKGGVEVEVKWQGFPETTWEPMSAIKKDDPVTLAKYALKHNLQTQARWKWVLKYKNQDSSSNLLKQICYPCHAPDL